MFGRLDFSNVLDSETRTIKKYVDNSPAPYKVMLRASAPSSELLLYRSNGVFELALLDVRIAAFG
jgi:hypothetical protein